MKTTHVFITFDDGMSTEFNIDEGTEDWIDVETGIRELRMVSGKEQFIKEAEKKTFINLGNLGLRRFKDIKEVHFKESEKE